MFNDDLLGANRSVGNQIDWLGDQTYADQLRRLRASRKNFVAILIAIAWRHVGYIMVLYLAGLKSVDPSLREAASIDGCNEWQSFRRVIFPVDASRSTSSSA